MKKTLLFVLTAAFAVGTASMSFAAQTDSECEVKQDIVILATSDVHCGVDNNFGYVGLEQIRKEFEENGDNTILVDCGDSIQGEPIGTLTKGESIIDLMNELDYDVAVPGNHDFDYGMDTFLKLTEEAEFPYICCNFSKDDELIFDPYLIQEVSGRKIGFVGVTTPKTLVQSTPAYFQDENGNFIYSFLQKDETGQMLYDAVQASVDSVRAEGAEYVFLLSHLGSRGDCEPWTYEDVVSHTTGIDLVLDGHSHDTDQVTMNDKDGNEVPRMGLGTKMNGIGCVKISAEDGSISHDFYVWNNTPSLPSLTGIENDMTDLLAGEMEKLGQEMEEVIAVTPYDLVIYDPEKVDKKGAPVRIVRKEETNLGDLMADVYLSASGADVAIENAGAIRIQVPAGNITYDTILTLQPFGNQLCVIEVSGQQILDALEWGAKGAPEENGGFLQVAGMTYEIHTDVPSSCRGDANGMFVGVDGEYRVQNVMVGGEALDPEKTYTLASHQYTLFEHGDGFTMFDGCKVLQDRVQLDNQMVINYLTESLGGKVPAEYANPHGQGRIIIVGGE